MEGFLCISISFLKEPMVSEIFTETVEPIELCYDFHQPVKPIINPSATDN